MQKLFENESVGRVLISDYTTQAKFVIPDIAGILDPKKYEVCNHDIQMGLNNILLSDEKFANSSIKVQVFMERLNEGRKVFIHDFLMPEIKRISKEMGFKNYPTPNFEDLDLRDNSVYDNNYGDWAKYIDVETLRIFSSSEVTNQYLLKVAAIYKLMFADSNLIDNELQNMFFKTIQDENIYQRIVYIGVHSDDRVAEVFRNRACCPGGDYQKNYADIIWEEDVELNSQLAEILEHQIHTITHVAFRLMHEDWDYKNPNSALRKSYQEAVDKNLFNAKSYEDRKYGDINEFYRVVTQEYIFWVIATEWDFRSVWKIPHKEFEIVNKKDIADKLPQSHKLYEEFVAKILTPPDRKLVQNILK